MALTNEGMCHVSNKFFVFADLNKKKLVLANLLVVFISPAFTSVNWIYIPESVIFFIFNNTRTLIISNDIMSH